MIYICDKKQQNAHFFIDNLINDSVFDMFRTSKCSSSGRIIHAVLWYISHAEIIIKAIRVVICFFLGNSLASEF